MKLLGESYRKIGCVPERAPVRHRPFPIRKQQSSYANSLISTKSRSQSSRRLRHLRHDLETKYCSHGQPGRQLFLGPSVSDSSDIAFQTCHMENNMRSVWACVTFRSLEDNVSVVCTVNYSILTDFQLTTMDCLCLDGAQTPSSAGPESPLVSLGRFVSGMCPNACSNLMLFIGITTAAKFISTLPRVGGMLVSLRSVSDRILN